jgi:hypothetical protein
MKKFLSLLLVTFVAGMAQAKHTTRAKQVYMKLEVAPLKVAKGVSVVGLHAAGVTQKVIVFSGNFAKGLADRAGVVVDTSSQAIVATGSAVNSLVWSTVSKAHTTTKNVVITSADFANKAYGLAYNAVAGGLELTSGVVENTLTTTASLATTLVTSSVDATATLISNTGVTVFDTTTSLIETLGGTLVSVFVSVWDFLGGLFGAN